MLDADVASFSGTRINTINVYTAIKPKEPSISQHLKGGQ